MANSAIKLSESTKRIVYKLFGDALEGRTLKIDAGGLTSALNANNFLLSTGPTTDRKPFYSLMLNHALVDITGGDTSGVVKITTDGSNAINSVITFSKTGDWRFNEGGLGCPINVAACGTASTGNVFLEFVGAQGANAAYTVILDFRKDIGFDRGKFSDPTAFNASTSANNSNKGPQ